MKSRCKHETDIPRNVRDTYENLTDELNILNNDLMLYVNKEMPILRCSNIVRQLIHQTHEAYFQCTLRCGRNKRDYAYTIDAAESVDNPEISFT
jgi:hypothetical protein